MNKRGNCIIKMAREAKRDYITPEDVSNALRYYDKDLVCLDLLEVSGGQTGFGVEDYRLCAFIAWKGKG